MTRKRRRHTGRVYLVCAIILGATCLLTSTRLARRVPAPAFASGPAELAPVRLAAIRIPPRTFYPYSVIRGGAYSVAELDAALRGDPVAAAHYADFDRTQMRIARAPLPAAVYVSYRKADHVYWTSRKVHLAAEEPLLSDGVHTARARCGNRISLTPREPVQTGEPSEIDLDLPEQPPTANADVFPIPVTAYEIFPAMAPAGVPGVAGVQGFAAQWMAGSAGSPGGILFPLSPGGSAPPGFTFPAPPEPTPPPAMPFPSAGFVWQPPAPPPGGGLGGGPSGGLSDDPGGIPAGPPPGGMPPAPPTVPGVPIGTSSFPDVPPPPGVPGVPGFPGIPGTPGIPGVDPQLTASGTPTFVPGPPNNILLTPGDPLTDDTEVPEPATAALLLSGVAILTIRRFRAAWRVTVPA